MPRRPHPKQDAIIAAYRDGASVPAVAQQFGLSVNTVYNRLGRATVPLRPRSRRVPLAPVMITALSTAYRTGETLGVLATRFGVSQEAVA